MCKCFREHPPEHFTLKDILELEADVAERIKRKPEDYLEPWCKVFKDGKLIRWDDANGKPIPEILWR